MTGTASGPNPGWNAMRHRRLPDPPHIRHRKSSYSDTNGNCVEAASADGAVIARDTTNRSGGTLTFTAEAWQVFTASLR